MKAEHRKELKTNTLVATLERVGHGLREGPSRRTVVIGGIVLLVVLLIVVWVLGDSVATRRDSQRGEQLYSATSTEDVDRVVEKNRNTVEGRAAQLQIAREELRDGLAQVYDRN